MFDQRTGEVLDSCGAVGVGEGLVTSTSRVHDSWSDLILRLLCAGMSSDGAVALEAHGSFDLGTAGLVIIIFRKLYVVNYVV